MSSFAGQTLFVSFSVNNDGAGGRTAMVVDDVRLQSCNATPGPVTTPTRTPTRTATPWATTPPVTAIPPIITLTPVPPGCVDLLQNGGFEGGWPPWIVPYNPILPQIVTVAGLQRRLFRAVRLADAKRQQLFLGAPVGHDPVVAPARGLAILGEYVGAVLERRR